MSIRLADATMIVMDTTMDRRVYTCWVLVERDPDAPDLWVSHCLNFDTVSQGASPAEAMNNVIEASSMAVLDDLMMGLDPNGRNAPQEEWDLLWKVVNGGKAVKISELPPEAKVRLASQFTLEAVQTVQTEDVLSQSGKHVISVPPLTVHQRPLAERIPSYASIQM